MSASVEWDGYALFSCSTGYDFSIRDWQELAKHVGHYHCMTDPTLSFRGPGTPWPAELSVDATGAITYVDSAGAETAFSHDGGAPILVSGDSTSAYFAVGYVSILQIDVEFESGYVLISRNGCAAQELCTQLLAD